MKSNIAILITSYNRKVQTVNCINAIKKNILFESTKISIYLVDDGSIDGTYEFIKNNFQSVNLIKGNGSLYWGWGMRLAWTTAISLNYDYYIWINDDVEIFEDTIENLLKDSRDKNNKAIICGSTISKKNNVISYGGCLKNNNSKIIPNGQLQECEIINGNIVLIPDDIYKSIGMIDVKFRHAIGDYDYGLRAIQKGFKCFVSPKYQGFCEFNLFVPDWMIKKNPLPIRIKSLYSPKSYSPPLQFFIYTYRHFGFKKAIKSFFLIHLRLIFPTIWKLLKS